MRVRAAVLVVPLWLVACGGGGGGGPDASGTIDAALGVDDAGNLIDAAPSPDAAPQVDDAGNLIDAAPVPDGGSPPPSPALCTYQNVAGQTFYVAGGGSNSSGTGAMGSPWATISHAVTQVPDGALILVGPGRYDGQVRLDRSFTAGITIRSQELYSALLRHTSTVIISFSGQGVTLEGFDVAHAGAGASGLVVQLANVGVRRLTLRNNILHDSFNNDILKINNGAREITVEGNLLFNQGPGSISSDEHMDVNSVEDVVVQDNVLFNDFAGSGRSNANDTSSFIVIKDSNGNDDGVLGARRVSVRRNVFFHWEGGAGSNFVLIGEDGTANYEAQEVTVENNLMLGDGSASMRSSFGIKGSRGVSFRANTIVGNLPSNSYAFRFNVEAVNMDVTDVELWNNVWADPTGTMNRFSDTPLADVGTVVLTNNAYWNNGLALPSNTNDKINISADTRAVTGDPRLPAQAGLVLPRWNPTLRQFAGGGATVCDVHRRLAQTYGTPAAGSALLGRADAAHTPAHDLIGTPRGATPDLGAIEVP